MGYAISGEFDGIYTGVNETPIIASGNLLIGVLNNRPLQQYLTINDLTPVDHSFKGILQSLDFTFGYKKFKKAELLIVTSDRIIYYWKDGVLFDIKGRYFAIGDGRQMAMGCLYGIRSSEYKDKERVEITLKAVAYMIPNQAMSTGYEKI